MNGNDRSRWDDRYARSQPKPVGDRFPVAVFAPFAGQFPTRGRCLEIACGQGEAAVWLARRGLDVHCVDRSPVAIAQARELASSAGAGDRCRFEVFDLDRGLPYTPNVDLMLCHNFRDPRLYDAMAARLVVGGLLAIATLSMVGAEPGRFRAQPDELRRAFAQFEILGEGEEAGQAWLVGRRQVLAISGDRE